MAWTFYGPGHPSQQAQNMGYSGSMVFDPQIGAEIAKLPGTLGTAAAGAFTGYAGGLGDMFRSYGGALGNIATAAANERGNLYGANAMMEAARQGTISNIGSAGLGAYGSASNSAFDAWARNQQAYNQSLASMNAANQTGMSQLGQSRNNALAGVAQAGSNTASSSFSMGGGMGGGSPLDMSFYASSPSGMVGRGSYGGRAGGGGGMSMSGSMTRGDAGAVNSALAGLNDRSTLQALQQGSRSDMDRLDKQHYSSRNQPREMLGDVYGGLSKMMSEAYGNSSAGADQYYSNANRALDAGLAQQRGILGSLDTQYTGTRGQLGSGFGATLGTIGRGLDMVGNTGMFSTPEELTRRTRAADVYRRSAAEEDRMAGIAANAARERAMLAERERLASAGVPAFARGRSVNRAGEMARASSSLGILRNLLQRARGVA